MCRQRAPREPDNFVASSPARAERPFSGLKPGAFLRRLVSWVALWVLAIFAVYSGWQIVSFLLIAAFGLAGQWEFYLAQEEKGHKVFKQSGLFCGALVS